MKKILISISILMFSFQVLADNLSDSNTLFQWAEKKFPTYFGQPSTETFQIQNYLVRRYAENTYLGTQSTNVFVYTPLLFKGKITRVGVISDFIDVHNQEAYDKAKFQLSQNDDYNRLKENLTQEAIEKDLGDSFVSELENELLKLSASSSDHQLDIIRKNLGKLVENQLMTKDEQQAIVAMYSDIINGESAKTQEKLTLFKQIVVSELGKLMASEIQEFVDKSTCDQQASNGENIGGAAGALGGAASGGFVGGVIGGIIGGPGGALGGALGAGSLGAFLGNAVGKAIGGLWGGSDKPDDGDGGDNCDNGDNGNSDGGDTDG